MALSVLQRIAAGDGSAVVECIGTYGKFVWGMARRLSRTTEDAEDATQEIFVDIWRCAKRFDISRGSDQIFIATIARRRLIDRLRKRSQEPPMESVDMPEIPDHARTSTDNGFDLHVAKRILTQLRPEQRQVLELNLLYGLSHAAISKRLNIPLGTVKSSLRRGLMHARELLHESPVPALNSLSASFHCPAHTRAVTGGPTSLATELARI